GEQAPVRGEGHAAGGAAWLDQSQERFPRSGVAEVQLVVARRSENPAVGAETEPFRPLVGALAWAEPVQMLPSRVFPDPDPAATPRGQELAVRGEANQRGRMGANHPRGRALERDAPQGLARGRLPEEDFVGTEPDGDDLPVGGEGVRP